MSDTVRKPSRIRFALLIFCFVYPMVTILLYGLVVMTPDWALWQRSLVLVPIIIVMMVFVIVPIIQRYMNRWITKPA
ncbi:hypothetical protein [Cohaesibacter gelatinilyticus]|uniref:Uncharacterized protein n=1 Tax=Cohaesibacter gelatinilyticus TaxID=372072 RepID=A0A285PDQ2_9HYPH|nr:hypothetical protein [Cohaesibacter gelatinilyticus]SNZ19849.1 hypothetical protein SAMN06265368_2944 [Cohaesibacter gelatinilyticus]